MNDYNMDHLLSSENRNILMRYNNGIISVAAQPAKMCAYFKLLMKHCLII